MQRKDAEAAQQQSKLRRQLVEAERQTTELEGQTQDLVAKNTFLKTKLGHQQAQSQARIFKLEQELGAARELVEMLQPQPAGPLQPSASVAPTREEEQPVRGQVVEDLVLENTNLKQELAQARATIKDLRVTQLVNESLELEVARLLRTVRQAQQIENENVRLGAKLEQHERAARAWAAIGKTPAQMGHQLAQVEARASLLERMLSTCQQVVEVQRRALGESHALKHKCDNLQLELDSALTIQARLKVHADTFKAHVSMLEAHIADKPVDLSPVQELEARFAESERPSAKRSQPESSSEALDSLVQKLLDSDKEIEALRTQLAAAQREAAAKVPQLEIVELQGYDPKVQARLDLADALERENEALKASKTGVPLDSIDVLNKRMAILKSGLEKKTIEAERAVASYQSAAAQLETAQESILGWKLQVRNNSTCLVHSKDLEVDPALRFFELGYDPSTNTYPTVSETSSVQAYQQQYELWIQERKCVPAFLASVLLAIHEPKYK